MAYKEDEETLATDKRISLLNEFERQWNARGDIVLGAATVILAMGQGRIAAAAINEYLKEKKKAGNHRA
jgi:NADPH-dependent glutamate synthase beta subunit-like oxidoreductase